jgi:hypothetical protein
VSDAKGVVEERLDEQIKIFGAPPCPTERITTERKEAPAYLYFFSYAPQKFIGNSSPCVSMNRRKQKRQRWLRRVRPYIHRPLLGAGAAAVVVVVALCGEVVAGFTRAWLRSMPRLTTGSTAAAASTKVTLASVRKSDDNP